MRLNKMVIPLVIPALLLVFLPWTEKLLERDSRILRRPLPPPPGSTDFKVNGVVNSEAFWIAIRYFNAHPSEFKNRGYITIIDYTKPSTTRRMAVIDVRSGIVRKYLVSHGKESGWSYATEFSNKPGSLKSSRGFFRTGGSYISEKLGACLELYGLQQGVNDNARGRGIVMHGAHYARGVTVFLNGGRLGRSQGCPAIPMEAVNEVIGMIKNGSLLYIHAG